MEHGHPIKLEESKAYAMAQIANTADTAAMYDTIPAHVANLPYVQLMPTNDSESLVNSGWLLLTNVASTYKQNFEPINMVSLPKLVVLRYVGEGHKSRVFLIKDGVEEKLLKLYHNFPANTAEAEAYDILNKSRSDIDTDKNIGPKYEGANIAVFEAHGTQIRAYVTLMEYIRAESLCDVSRKVHKESMQEFEEQLNTMMRSLHEKGVAHGNITASNILIDDPTRYQASLEFKPLSRNESRVRLVGFSSALFQEKLEKSKWDAARRQDRSKVEAVCAEISAQQVTTNAIKLVKRVCENSHQDGLRQRGIVRTLPQADPYDNELHAGLLDFRGARLQLVLAVAEHFEKGGKYQAALQWLERHKEHSSEGKPEEYVSVHTAIAKILSRLHEPNERIADAWDQAMEYSRECTGLASRQTMQVRRGHAMWLLESGKQEDCAKSITTILQDIMKYYRRGTGAEMTDDATFMGEMGLWMSEMKLRQSKEKGPMVIPRGKNLDDLTEAMSAWASFSTEVEAAREEKRRKQDEMKKEKTSTSASQSPPDSRAGGGSKSTKTTAKRPANGENTPESTPSKKPRKKATTSKKAT